MRVLCVFGRHNYGNPARGEGYEFTSFLPGLKALGHTVSHFDSWGRSSYRSFGELNRALLQAIESTQPEIVLTVPRLYEVWLETWALVRSSGGPVLVAWATDDSWKYKQLSRFVAPAFHTIATTHRPAVEAYHRDGHHNVFLTQWAAADNRLQEPLMSKDCHYDVTFIGTAYGNRAALVDSLKSVGIRVHCFGHGWPSGPVDSSEISRIVRESRISLNFSAAGQKACWRQVRVEPQIKARNFEVPGLGGFLLTESAPGIEEYYHIDREISVFASAGELVDKVRHFLATPSDRDRIAFAGFKRTISQHTYSRRFAPLLSTAIAARNAEWESRPPTTGWTVDWKQFEGAVDQHRLTKIDRAVRGSLIGCLAWIWGAQRGPRAARRLLFEAEWRLAGAQVYRAAGLPGKLFFHES